MAQAQRHPEHRSAQVTIPQLTSQEIQLRSGRAFDAAVTQIIRSNFSTAPSRAEMTSFQNLVNQRIAGGSTVDIANILEDFAENNPDSTIATYYYSTARSTAWIFDETTGRIRFSASALSTEMTRQFNAYRDSIVAACVQLSNPSNRSTQQDMHRLEDELPGIPSQLQVQLSAQFGGAGGRNQIPVAIEYINRILIRSGRPVLDSAGQPVYERYLAFNNLQAPPTQEVGFK
ncbi:MAG: hypothetical protein ABH983_01395 [Candidatus Micrarchaeota archaeon]